MGKHKEKSPLSEISIELHSIQSSSASTGGYRDEVNSEHDFVIGGHNIHHDDDEYFEQAVSDITVLSRAVDEGPQQPRRSKRGMVLPCLIFIVCVLAIVLFGGRNSGKIGINTTTTVLNGPHSDADDATSNGNSGVAVAGNIVEFTVANLNTNANNCTQVQNTHVLQCIPSHNNATNKFRIQLHPAWAPIGVARFEELTTSSFWHDVRIFRTVPNFISQFGISSNTEVQQRWSSLGPLVDDPVTVSNLRGRVSFATSGENTRTTQIFINTADNLYLDDQGFSPIGEVLPAGEGYGGMEVVDEFYSGYGNQPSQIRIKREGFTYLSTEYPLLSYFVKTEFVPPKDLFHD